jgi:hypothetical protein
MLPWQEMDWARRQKSGSKLAGCCLQARDAPKLRWRWAWLAKPYTYGNGFSMKAAWMPCARIAAAYPSFWPETIRGLMVHSARWTQPMRDAYRPGGMLNQDTKRQLLRHCGYGVPSLERALYSARNSLTMIVQDEIHPYHKVDGDVKTREMHLHDLPWPNEVLQYLGDMPVTLRVTLSYFIEPNPGERGGIDKYAYQSHALRFAVRRPLETEAAFRGRINAQAAAQEQGLPGAGSADVGWMIGERLRKPADIHRGPHRRTGSVRARCTTD